MILSDVVGDPLEYIASGPTVLSRRELAGDQGDRGEIPAWGADPAAYSVGIEFPAPAPFSPQPPNNILVGNNLTAANAAIQAAESLGYHAGLLTNTLSGEARLVGQEYGEMLKMLAEEEPTVR